MLLTSRLLHIIIYTCIDKTMQIGAGTRFYNTYAYKGVFNPKLIFQYFRQIPPRVCTLVLFILVAF